MLEKDSKVIVRNGEKGLECEDHVDGIYLENVLEFKYLGCVLDDEVQTEQSVVGRW